MADTPKKLSDTARAVLTHAATRDDHLAQPPKLPIEPCDRSSALC